MTIFLSNREIYERVACGIVPQAKERLWIATADIKDLYVCQHRWAGHGAVLGGGGRDAEARRRTAAHSCEGAGTELA